MKRILLSALLLLSFAGLMPSSAQQKSPDKKIVGTWVLVYMQYEGEPKVVCGKDYSQVKYYGPTGEYACAEVVMPRKASIPYCLTSTVLTRTTTASTRRWAEKASSSSRAIPPTASGTTGTTNGRRSHCPTSSQRKLSTAARRTRLCRRTCSSLSTDISSTNKQYYF